MPINIQGNWTVELISTSANLQQRFVVSNASFGNGTYYESSGFPIQVQGASWTVNMQADGTPNGQPGSWVDSDIQKDATSIVNGKYVFFLRADDYFGGDFDYNDLVLKFSQPIPITPPVNLPPVIPPPIIPNLPPPTPPPPPVVLAPGKVYTKLTTEDKLPTQVNRVYYGIWTDATGSMIGNMVTFHTCSSETSESYRRTIYQTPCTSHCKPAKHFGIAYGNDAGSGSRDLGGYDWLTPSNAIYGQFRSLCLDPDQRRFRMGSKEVNHFYVIDVHRDRFGDRLDEGNTEINLHHLSGSQFLAGNGNRNAHTGSNVRLGTAGNIIRLVDDSRLDLETLNTAAYAGYYQEASESKCHLTSRGGEVYFMVSGTLEDGVYNPAQPHVYGLSYPRLGVILLDADMLDLSASFLSVTGSDVAGDNAMKLFTSLSGSALYTDASGDVLGLQARKVKYEYIEQYFVRVKNGDYNFTNNPSYQTGSEGQIIDDFYNNPQVFITQVGLYNDNKELLAVGKLSRPIFKTYVDEALIQVDIKYD